MVLDIYLRILHMHHILHWLGKIGSIIFKKEESSISSTNKQNLLLLGTDYQHLPLRCDPRPSCLSSSSLTLCLVRTVPTWLALSPWVQASHVEDWLRGWTIHLNKCTKNYIYSLIFQKFTKIFNDSKHIAIQLFNSLAHLWSIHITNLRIFLKTLS